MIMGDDAVAPPAPASVKSLTLPDQPYRSLAYYDEADRLLFTGRNADVIRFAATLDRPDTRILVLHGESGIGKSSLLRAGVIPYLEQECVGYRFLRNDKGQVVIIQATKDPVGRLVSGLLEMTERPLEYPTPNGDVRTIDLRHVLSESLGTKADAAALRPALMADSGRLAMLLEQLSAHLPHAVVLVLDQADELFTLAKTPKEIKAAGPGFAVAHVVGRGEGQCQGDYLTTHRVLRPTARPPEGRPPRPDLRPRRPAPRILQADPDRGH